MASRSTQPDRRTGCENQGWKDSGDAVVYPDGSQAEPPIALCELQGYVYDAKLRMAESCEALGDPSGRRRCASRRGPPQASASTRRSGGRTRAPTASGSTRDKQPIRTVASNAGHCLLVGHRRRRSAPRGGRAADAAGHVERLGHPHALRATTRPTTRISYHRGSVWPHDNGIIAAGFKRYGSVEEARRVAERSGRPRALRLLPPARALRRPAPRAGCFPVQYLGANIPQAWAAATIFRFVAILCGIHSLGEPAPDLREPEPARLAALRDDPQSPRREGFSGPPARTRPRGGPLEHDRVKILHGRVPRPQPTTAGEPPR